MQALAERGAGAALVAAAVLIAVFGLATVGYVSFLSFFFFRTNFFAPSSLTIVDGHRDSITSELPVGYVSIFFI